ncbi:MAG: hypothetical protein PUB32_04325 [Clostridiales bacterium]|nr:hypothetical protein [Clostridiales bacterium]
MSDFLKFAYELIAQVVYNLTAWIVAFVQGFIRLFITGWIEYYGIFTSYFGEFGFFSKVLSIILVILLIAIPIVVIVLIARRVVLHIQLKADRDDNRTLYKEIGRLNKQVLDLMDEKNKILSLKVNNNGAAGTPYLGGDGLADPISGASPLVVPAVAAGEGDGIGMPVIAGGFGVAGDGNVGEDVISNAAAAAATAAAQARLKTEEEEKNNTNRFPKLSLVDLKYEDYDEPDYDDQITLKELAEGYRLFACSQMHLYYTPEIVRRFIAGMAASKILILEGISGTGKTSLPYSFSRYLCNVATMVSVQPSFRDRTELLGYFNEFSKRFNETEFLRALYEANFRKDPTIIVLDEMNLARIEYYFAEMLSVLEMPSQDEWVLDLVPTAWPGDPIKLDSGKIHVSPTTWFVGTANNDDSTFTITDKVYDRAMPIELNERAEAFECELQPACSITYDHLKALFEQAKAEYPISQSSLDKMKKLDNYLQTRFKLAFGNRIIKQMYEFVPVYVACGGTELGGMDYIIARKVLKKFESLNVMFVRDEIKGLIEYIEKTFGSGEMKDSIEYLQRIRNLV